MCLIEKMPQSRIVALRAVDTVILTRWKIKEGLSEKDERKVNF